MYRTTHSTLVAPPQLQLVICTYWFAPLNAMPVVEHAGELIGVATSPMDDQYVSATTTPVVQSRKSHSCSVPSQLAEPVVENLPETQSEHIDAPAASEKVPAAHIEHIVSPNTRKYPAGQLLEQDDEAETLYDPETQEMQADEADVENIPETHAAHEPSAP
jgi:hypothetical protein